MRIPTATWGPIALGDLIGDNVASGDVLGDYGRGEEVVAGRA